jgi:hypothetical protein
MVLERVLWMGCAALTLSACGYKYVETPRSLSSQTREVPSFDAIEFEGEARVEITVGESRKVVLRGSPNVIKRTETKVVDNTLHIDVQAKDWSWGQDRRRLVLQIEVPQLRSLQLDGGTDVQLRGFDGGESNIGIHGAARIRASGKLEHLTVHLAGAGQADLSELVADDAKVTLDGVGSVYVHPKESLDATMNGVGAIFYSGKPKQVNSWMNGLGTISRRDADGDQQAQRHHRKHDADADEDAEDSDDDSDEDSEDATI